MHALELLAELLPGCVDGTRERRSDVLQDHAVGAHEDDARAYGRFDRAQVALDVRDLEREGVVDGDLRAR